MEIDWVREGLDTIVSLNGKWARWINIRGSRYGFLLIALNTLYWCGRDIYCGLYSPAVFAIVAFFMNLYGFWYWKKEKIGKQ